MRQQKRRDDGDGTIYNEGEGRWRAALIIDGKTVRRRAKSEREAKAKLKELLQMREQRLNLGDGKQTVKTWCEFWLTTILPGKEVKPKTLQGHRFVVEQYILPYLGHYQLIKLSAQHIDEWQGKLKAAGLATGTITNARRRLNTALEIARKRKLVAENVVALTDAPPEPVRKRTEGETFLTENQIATLLDQLRSEQHRLYALYALACTTGMRQGELMGLRWPAINLEAGTLTVKEQLQRIGGKIHREPTTKGGKDRIIYLAATQIVILQAHQAHQQAERELFGEQYQGGDLVFVSEDGTPLEAGSLRRQFRRALKRAELPPVTFHSLRHSAGSIMLANGAQLVDVSFVLGHANPAITARIYAHSYEEGQRRAVAAATNALLGEEKNTN